MGSGTRSGRGAALGQEAAQTNEAPAAAVGASTGSLGWAVRRWRFGVALGIGEADGLQQFGARDDPGAADLPVGRQERSRWPGAHRP